MSSPIDGQGDLFDEMVPKQREAKEVELLTQENVIRTAYLLSNVVLEVLVKKGIIQESEIDELLREAALEYKRKRVN